MAVPPCVLIEKKLWPISKYSTNNFNWKQNKTILTAKPICFLFLKAKIHVQRKNTFMVQSISLDDLKCTVMISGQFQLQINGSIKRFQSPIEPLWKQIMLMIYVIGFTMRTCGHVKYITMHNDPVEKDGRAVLLSLCHDHFINEVEGSFQSS